VADEAWSADADWGAADGGCSSNPAAPEIRRQFAGTYRFTVTMNEHPPATRVAHRDLPVADAAGEGGPPLGATTLFLRGTPNNWAALDDYAFQFSCDAYYLNVKLQGRHEFKIADAAWKPASTIAADAAGQVNFTQDFTGEHTLRLAWAGGRPQLSVGARSFADPRAVAVTDPIALSLRFDSRDAAHKAPFGAQPAGAEMQFALRAGTRR
jgi:cyclomaltodextrinase